MGRYTMEEEVRFVLALTEGGMHGWVDFYYK